MKSLNHKVVGTVSGGNIGRRIVRQVQAFGAETVYFDVSRFNETVESEYTMRFLSLDELLKISDIVFFRVPLLESTHHL